jgi:hypothetical protein
MITLDDNFRLGARPEDILGALHTFTKRAKKREYMAMDRVVNREHYNAYNRYRYSMEIEKERARQREKYRAALKREDKSP